MTSGATRVWYGDDLFARGARMALWPAAAAYRVVTEARNTLYDSGVLSARNMALPTISIGNLTVGGTGKTPVAAWLAGELARRGAKPAIVLRGYGADEPLVHERLNPGIPVVVNADRVAGVARADELGATVAVLDDAFQHRRAARDADVVLLSAERGIASARMLPAGPFREPLSSLRRASLVVVTRKTASLARAESLSADVSRAFDVPCAVMSLAPESLVRMTDGDTVAMAALRDAHVMVFTGVGEPELVAEQLRGIGAQVELRAYPDHHAFSDAELASAAASARDGAYAVCTLKDAVKVSQRWPGPGPLWYLSQQVHVDLGADLLDGLLNVLVVAI
ncbi:MAG TPA: tetraacyldisaccharide 4'-kinase [Gemmatimonadaceae bacterium]